MNKSDELKYETACITESQLVEVFGFTEEYAKDFLFVLGCENSRIRLQGETECRHVPRVIYQRILRFYQVTKKTSYISWMFRMASQYGCAAQYECFKQWCQERHHKVAA